MPAGGPNQITQLLRAWRGGDQGALEQLTPLVYAELYRIAQIQLARESANHMLQSSALVHEAYLRLLGEGNAATDWQDRQHFFAFSSRLMRQILIDFARSFRTQKRGNKAPHLDLSSVWALPDKQHLDFLELDIALTKLAELDPRQAQIVELRFFGGMANEEIAEVLGVSIATVIRDWRVARAWLFDELSPTPRAGLSPA
ncbi:DNA-directed RNA polymerase sigma-70 factor [Bryobacterales bacterium F-183]|nr:DNA-directed RNA polymerase sigma-70 factor [Bryobacterales bacterium F-183]